MIVRARAQRRQQQVQLAGMGNETLAVPEQPVAGSAVSQQAPAVPAGFDAAGFLRAAKMNFIKLQVANDAGKLDEIREFTTREMYEELRRDIDGGQQTDVSRSTRTCSSSPPNANQHWASVRFSGMVRETPGTEPVGFEEVWNLVKPADGSTGWLLAGIQQMH